MAQHCWRNRSSAQEGWPGSLLLQTFIFKLWRWRINLVYDNVSDGGRTAGGRRSARDVGAAPVLAEAPAVYGGLRGGVVIAVPATPLQAQETSVWHVSGEARSSLRQTSGSMLPSPGLDCHL